MTKRDPTELNPVYQIIGVRTAQASLVALAVSWALHWPLTGPRALGLFLTPALCLYFVFVFVARWSWGLPILTRLPTPMRCAALTFDDGPSPETTPLVLDLLRDAGVPATFFVLGEAIERYPDLLKRIVAEGHSLGIHAYRHRSFVLLDSREIQNEIRATRKKIYQICPKAVLTSWLRPPHGFKTLSMIVTAKRNGCKLAAWSLDSQDYRIDSPDRIARNVLDHLKPGTIILLHDGPTNTATLEALPLILRGMKASGWQAVPLPCKRRTTP